MKIVQHLSARAWPSLLLTGFLMVGLAACDSGASAVKAPTGGLADADIDRPTAAQISRGEDSERGDPRDAPVRLIAGKPYWAANRTRTPEENAQRSFERNGEVFGAKSVDDYVAKVHAFVSDPPKGSQTIKRSNGDLLIYDPKGNVFAVVSREGAPRTMFKPDEGDVYWSTQKDREARRASAAKTRDRNEAEG